MKDQEVNVKSYSQMLQDGLDAVFSSEEYHRFLSFIANNPTYSYRNVLLILQQCPHATKVMGFQAWKKVGRVANQKGLRINARFAEKDEEETVIQKIAKKSKKEKNFRRISVWDISQTVVVDEDLAYEQAAGEPEIMANGVCDPFRTDMLEGEVEGYDEIIRTINEFSPLAHALLTVLKFQTQDNLAFHTAIELPASESMTGFKKGRGL